MASGASRVSYGIAVVIACLVVYDIGRRRGEAKRDAAAAKAVAAQEFQVVSSGGEIRARLTTARDHPSLALYDSDGKTPRSLLAITPDGEPVFTLLDRDGRTPRLVADVTAAPAAASSTASTSAAVHIYDSSGKAVWTAP